jgi:hypothetical protein
MAPGRIVYDMNAMIPLRALASSWAVSTRTGRTTRARIDINNCFDQSEFTRLIEGVEVAKALAEEHSAQT